MVAKATKSSTQPTPPNPIETTRLSRENDHGLKSKQERARPVVRATAGRSQTCSAVMNSRSWCDAIRSINDWSWKCNDQIFAEVLKCEYSVEERRDSRGTIFQHVIVVKIRRDRRRKARVKEVNGIENELQRHREWIDRRERPRNKEGVREKQALEGISDTRETEKMESAMQQVRDI